MKKLKPPEPPPGTARLSLVVTIDSADRIYLGDSKISPENLDSLLKVKIDKLKKGPFDTVQVVIDVDSAAHYGTVVKVLSQAKRQGAKVVAVVK